MKAYLTPEVREAVQGLRTRGYTQHTYSGELDGAPVFVLEHGTVADFAVLYLDPDGGKPTVDIYATPEMHRFTRLAQDLPLTPTGPHCIDALLREQS